MTATKHKLGLSPLFRAVSLRLSIGSLGPPDEIALITRVYAAKLLAVEPLQRAALTLWLSGVLVRGRSNALIFAVLDGASITDPEPLMFSRNPGNMGLRTQYLVDNRKKQPSPPASDSSLALHLYHCSRVASCTRGARLLQT